MRFQRSKRQVQRSKKHLLSPKLGLLRNHGLISEIEEVSAFSASSAPVTRKLSFAKITENLSKYRSQIAKMRLSLSASSALVTCRESFEEITGSLSKR
ncbi:hypothetical protein COP2_035702 [Malus domestica]